MFWPCMPVGERVVRRVTWNHFLFAQQFAYPTTLAPKNTSLVTLAWRFR
jgi:hypothetical protein